MADSSLFQFRYRQGGWQPCDACMQVPEAGGRCEKCGTEWTPDDLGTLQRKFVTMAEVVTRLERAACEQVMSDEYLVAVPACDLLALIRGYRAAERGE